MKFKKFFYKKVNSTNDLAIKKIKTGIIKGIIIAEYQKKVEVNKEKNGYHLREICLLLFFLK